MEEERITEISYIRNLERQVVEQHQTIERLEEVIVRLEAEVKRLKGQVSKDSHNSGKPPASDGYKRRPHAVKAPSGKKSGGQLGHEGHSLQQITTPDRLEIHGPSHCSHCERNLETEDGSVIERRQVRDIPALKIEVVEHQVEMVVCPHCHHEAYGRFPEGVEAPVQYGEHIRALATYLHQYQLIPLDRTQEAILDLTGVALSEGTLITWEEKAASDLVPHLAQLRWWLKRARIIHADETGIRVRGKLVWLHVVSTRWMTYLEWHAKRGKDAMRAIGIWPHLFGRAMHDRWASYDTFACAHDFCKAHLIRDLTYLHEQEHQEWAAEMRELLLAMHAAAQERRGQGASTLPEEELRTWQAHYFEVIAQGYIGLPTPTLPMMLKRGKPKAHPAKNLLDVLLGRAESVLGFVQDLSRPFTNNQAEQDLRMAKVQQKISGGFRTAKGATVFCALRSYVLTMRKQGHRAFEAICSLFRGSPLPIAWDGQVSLAGSLT
jgi:transposase